MNWTEDNVIKLIELFEKRSYLYVVTDADYRNRCKKKFAYQEIAAAIGTTGECSFEIIKCKCKPPTLTEHCLQPHSPEG